MAERHTAFKLPLDLAKQENPVCNISCGSAKARLFNEVRLIIWDEATTSHKVTFKALDATLRDLRQNDRLMRSVRVVLSSDF